MLYLPQQTPTAPTPAAVPTLMRSLSPGLDPLLRSHLPFSKLSVPPPPIGRFILLVMVLGVLRPAHPSVGSPSSGTTEDLDSVTRMLRPSSGEQSWPWTPRVSTPSKQASEQGEKSDETKGKNRRESARGSERGREGARSSVRAPTRRTPGTPPSKVFRRLLSPSQCALAPCQHTDEANAPLPQRLCCPLGSARPLAIAARPAPLRAGSRTAPLAATRRKRLLKKARSSLRAGVSSCKKGGTRSMRKREFTLPLFFMQLEIAHLAEGGRSRGAILCFTAGDVLHFRDHSLVGTKSKPTSHAPRTPP